MGAYWKPVFHVREGHVRVALANAQEGKARKGHKRSGLCPGHDRSAGRSQSSQPTSETVGYGPHGTRMGGFPHERRPFTRKILAYCQSRATAEEPSHSGGGHWSRFSETGVLCLVARHTLQEKRGSPRSEEQKQRLIRDHIRPLGQTRHPPSPFRLISCRTQSPSAGTDATS